MTTTLVSSPPRRLPAYVPGLLAICVLAGLALAWSSTARSTNGGDVAPVVGQADAVLVEALRADDTDDFAEAHAGYLTVLADRPNHQEALRGAAIADLGLHRFDAALERATIAVELAPYDHIARAALVDANIELGFYDAAQRELDALLALRPGLEASSRLSYLRQLLGDWDGAFEAMGQARAGAAGLTFETARIDALIGELAFARGDDDTARHAYERALSIDPDRLDAAVGLAAITFRAGDATAALAMLDDVYAVEEGETAALILEAEIAASLGDLDRAAEAANAVALDALAEHEAGFGIDPSAALPASSWGDPELGLRVASIIHDARPDNVRVAHAYAWALFRAGQPDAAVAPMLTATQFGVDDLVLADHAAQVLG